MEGIKVFSFIDEEVKHGKKVAMAMITESKGSAPRKSGAIMAIAEDGRIEGTIGGGELENRVTQAALEILRKRSDEKLHFELNDEGKLGMKCGGEAEVYIKTFLPENRLIIAGCGHIGKALYTLGRFLGFKMIMMDDRDDYASEDNFSSEDIVLRGDIGENLKGLTLGKSDYVVIVTRGHKYDGEALRAVIESDAKYVGMIGSKEKIIHTMDVMKKDGVSIDKIERVHSPIGLDIADGSPAEIAVAIISEILKVKNGKSGNHIKNIKIGEKYFA